MKKRSQIISPSALVLIICLAVIIVLVAIPVSVYFYNKRQEDRALQLKLREQICKPKDVTQTVTNTPGEEPQQQNDDRMKFFVQNFGGGYGGNGISSTLERSVEPDVGNINEFCKE